MSNLKHKTLSGIFWTAFQQFGGQIISFGVSIILARILLPEEFGLIAMVTVFIGIGASIVDAGLGQSLIRTDKPSNEEYATVFYFNLGASVLVYILLFFVAPYLSIFYEQEILTEVVRWYGLTIVINSFSLIQKTRLTKELNFKALMRISIPSITIGGSVGVCLAYFDYGVWSLVAMFLVHSLTSTLLFWSTSKWRPHWVFKIQKFKHHFNFGYKLNLSGIIDDVFANIYAVIIGKFFAPIMVGYYNRAETLKQFPVLNISEVINNATYPVFSEIKDDNLRLKSAYKRILQLVVFLIAPMLLVMAALAEPFFRFLFTEKWLPAVPYFQILCLNGILYPINSYNLTILKLKGRTDLHLKLEVFKKIVTVVVLLISFQYGVFGLLYGSVVLSIVAFIVNSRYAGRLIGYGTWEQIKDVFPSIFMGMVTCFLVYGVDLFLKDTLQFDSVRLILGGGIGASLVVLIAMVFKMSSFFEITKVVWEFRKKSLKT